MVSIPGASSSSIYKTPSLQLLKRPTSTTTASISLDNNRLFRLNTFLRPNHNRPTVSFVISAIATPNSSLLTAEEAFKGFASDDSKNNDQLRYDLEIDTPVTISKDELDISKLRFPSKLVDSLKNRGITNLFPIQRAVLLPAIEGRDIIARAKTGTGKTLAFGIPIIKGLIDGEQSTQRRSGRLPKVLVLAPTRELAKQVDKEIQESAPYLNTICVYGGVSYVTQKSALLRGVDVVVGTPGRLIDLINGNCLKLSEVQYLVLDEADQMLAVGFEEDVEMILERVPSQRQVMLFSATMPGWVKKLSRKHLSNPLTIDLVGENEEKLAEGIKLYAISATAASKRTILSELISVYAKGGKTIVFTRTKRDADEVSFSLANASQALHGDISQYQRERTLNGFRQGRFKVLVATDVAARGLDIPNVDLVIHFELPNNPETFVHRSGRTGRAGNEGTVVLMYTSSQKRTVNSLERDVGSKFEFIKLPAMEGISELSDDDDEPPSGYSRKSPRDYYGRSSGYNRKADPSDYYGRFSDRDGSNRRGSGDRSSFKTSGDDWLIGGSRSSRGSGDRGSFKTSGDEWRIGGSRSSRGGSYGGGACFNCGQSGHRAAVCPQKR